MNWEKLGPESSQNSRACWWLSWEGLRGSGGGGSLGNPLFLFLVPPDRLSNIVISKGSRLNTLYLKVHITAHVIFSQLESHVGDSHLWWYQGFFRNTENTFSVQTTTTAYLGSKGSFHKPPLERMVECLGTIWKHCIFHAEESGSMCATHRASLKIKPKALDLPPSTHSSADSKAGTDHTNDCWEKKLSLF